MKGSHTHARDPKPPTRVLKVLSYIVEEICNNQTGMHVPKLPMMQRDPSAPSSLPPA